jgi:hypothetical protein
MSKIDPKVKEILSKYHDNPEEAVWQHKQSGQWLAKHKALEIIAARAGITYDKPTVLEFDLEKKIAAIVVIGRLGDKEEWSIGEATSYNSQNNYYGSMAEKRGKDRVILKLLGLHGEVYSDEEIDNEKPTTTPIGHIDSDLRKEADDMFIEQLEASFNLCQSSNDVNSLITSRVKKSLGKLSKSDNEAFLRLQKRKNELLKSFETEEGKMLQQFKDA